MMTRLAQETPTDGNGALRPAVDVAAVLMARSRTLPTATVRSGQPSTSKSPPRRPCSSPIHCRDI
ncbi:MAG TPA: hypothetical protein VHC69_14840 [Polyangiaceae bacterium]|nr:hypothetical protein [Polyangiaceae bacterium]